MTSLDGNPFDNSFDERLRSMRLDRAARVAAAMTEQKSADALGEARRLAERLGRPVARVLADVEQARTVAAQNETIDPSFDRNFPALAARLDGDFEFLTMARDDLGNLKSTETTLGWFGRAFDSSVDNLSLSFQSGLSEFTGLPKPTVTAATRQVMRENQQVMAQRDGDNWGTDAVNFLTSLGVTAAGGVAGFAVGGPPGAIAGAASASIALGTGEVYNTLIDEGYTPAEASSLSKKWGLVIGSLDAVGAGKVATTFGKGIGKKLLPKLLRRGVSQDTTKELFVAAVKDYAVDLGVETATEVLQQAAVIAARYEAHADYRTGDYDINVSAELWDTLVHSARGMVLVGAVPLSARIGNSIRQSANAKQAAKTHQEVETLEAQSKLSTRSPEDRANFVNDAAPDSIKTVYIRPEKFLDVVDAYKQTPQGSDILEELETSFPGIIARAEKARDDGVDLTMPIGQWSSKLARSDFGRQLMPHTVYHQDADTESEREELNPLEGDFSGMADEAAKQAAEDEAYREQLTEIYDSYYEQAVAAGRPVDESRVFASMMRNVVAQLARKEGVTLEEYRAKRPLPRVTAVGDAALKAAPTFEQFREQMGEWIETAPGPKEDVSQAVMDGEMSFKDVPAEAVPFTAYYPPRTRNPIDRSGQLFGSAKKDPSSIIRNEPIIEVKAIGGKKFAAQSENSISLPNGDSIDIPITVVFEPTRAAGRPGAEIVKIVVPPQVTNLALPQEVLDDEADLMLVEDDLERVFRTAVRNILPTLRDQFGVVMGKLTDLAPEGQVRDRIRGALQFTGMSPSSLQTGGQFYSRSPAETEQTGAFTFRSAFYDEVAKLGAAKKMKASGWRDLFTRLQAKGVVDQDELYWSAIDEWLDLQPPGKIHANLVLSWLRSSLPTVRLKERNMEDVQGPYSLDDIGDITDGMEQEFFVTDEDGAQGFDTVIIERFYGDQGAADEFINDQAMENHAQVTVEKTENPNDPDEDGYRVLVDGAHFTEDGPDYEFFEDESSADEYASEVRFTMVDRYRDENYRVVEGTIYDFDEQEAEDLVEQYNEDYVANNAPDASEFASYTAGGYGAEEDANYREVTVALNGPQFYTVTRHEFGKTAGGESLNENMLFHMRTTDRDTADGRRVLQGEEIQSDYAQYTKDEEWVNPLLTRQVVEAATEESYRIKDKADDLTKTVGVMEEAFVDEQVRQTARVLGGEEALGESASAVPNLEELRKLYLRNNMTDDLVFDTARTMFREVKAELFKYQGVDLDKIVNLPHHGRRVYNDKLFTDEIYEHMWDYTVKQSNTAMFRRAARGETGPRLMDINWARQQPETNRDWERELLEFMDSKGLSPYLGETQTEKEDSISRIKHQWGYLLRYAARDAKKNLRDYLDQVEQEAAQNPEQVRLKGRIDNMHLRIQALTAQQNLLGMSNFKGNEVPTAPFVSQVGKFQIVDERGVALTDEDDKRIRFSSRDEAQRLADTLIVKLDDGSVLKTKQGQTRRFKSMKAVKDALKSPKEPQETRTIIQAAVDYGRVEKFGDRVEEADPTSARRPILRLGAKQLLLLAINEGYDGLTFVNGEQVSDMYSVGSRLDKLEVEVHADEGDGLRTVRLFPKGGGLRSYDWVVDRDGMVIKAHDKRYQVHLKESVGKEFADDIMAVESTKTYEGMEQLTFGYEGYRRIYEKMLGKEFREILKPLGLKPEFVPVTSGMDDYFEETPNFTPEEAIEAVLEGQSVIAVREADLDQDIFGDDDAGYRRVGESVPRHLALAKVNQYIESLQSVGATGILDQEVVNNTGTRDKAVWAKAIERVEKRGIEVFRTRDTEYEDDLRPIDRLDPPKTLDREMITETVQDLARSNYVFSLDRTDPATPKPASKQMGVMFPKNLAARQELKDKVRGGLPLFGQTDEEHGLPRGGYSPELREILLNQAPPEEGGADSSTLFHEMAHFYLEELTHIAIKSPSNSAAQQDLRTILKWKNLSLDEWSQMDMDQRRPIHEAFALNFEQWLYEGKAPSEDMRGAFSRLRAWFAAVYTDIVTKINRAYRKQFQEDLPALTPEVKAVFGRMVATEAEVRAMFDAGEFEVLFQSEQEYIEAGGTAEDYAKLIEKHKAVEEEAIDELTRKRLRQMELASGAVHGQLAKMQRKHNARRRELRAEIEPALRLSPIERLRSWIRNGEHLDEDGEIVSPLGRITAHKLNTGEVRQRVDARQLQRLRKAKALSDTGANPDQVADMFGYNSGDELLEALTDEPEFGDAVNAEIDRRIRLENPELVDPKLIREQVAEATHNKVRRQVVASELRLLTRDERPVRLLQKAAKNVATERVRELTVDAASPSRFALAARRARRDATAAIRKGDLAEARAAKRRELMSESMIAAIADFNKEKAKALKLFTKAFRADKKLQKTRDINVVHILRSLLATLDAGRKQTDPDGYLELVAQYAPQLVEELTPRLNRVRQLLTDKGLQTRQDNRPRFESLTVDEFREFAQLATLLWNQSRRVREVTFEGRRMLREKAVEQAKQDLAAALPEKDTRGLTGAITASEDVQGKVGDYFAGLVRVEHLFRRLGGIFPKLFTRVKEAGNKKRKELRKAANDIRNDFAKLDLKGREKIEAPEIGYTFGKRTTAKAEILGMLTHYYSHGSDTHGVSNRDKLLKGFAWTEEAVEKFVRRMVKEDVLTAADFEWIQSVYDRNASYVDQVQKAHYKAYGFYMKLVKTEKQQTPFGELPGGYVPARPDPKKVDRVVDFEQDALAEAYGTWPVYERGFAMERSANVAMLLDFDIGNQIIHIEQVLNFIHMHPAVRDVSMVLGDANVQAQMNRDLGARTVQTIIKPWLKRSAEQTIGPPPATAAEKAVTWLARGAQMGIMFLNVVNALQNFTGLGPILRETKGGYVGRAALRYLREGKKMGRAAAEVSDEMAERMEKQVFDLVQESNNILIGDGVSTRVRRGSQFVNRNTYVLQTATQHTVDVIGWWAHHDQVYAEQLAADVDVEVAEQTAIREADSLIRRTQMAGAPEDVSSVEAQGGLWRAIMPFKSWFINWFNYQGQRLRADMNKEGTERVAALLGTYATSILVPGAIATLMAEGLRGEFEDEDEDGYLDESLSLLLRSHIDLYTGAMPIFGDVGKLTAAFYDDHTWNNRMPTPPYARLIERLAKTPSTLTDGEIKTSDIYDALGALGAVLHVPIEAFGKRVKYLEQVDADDDFSELLRGLLAGR